MGWIIVGAMVVGTLGMIGWSGKNDDYSHGPARNVAFTLGVAIAILALGGALAWVLSYGNT